MPQPMLNLTLFDVPSTATYGASPYTARVRYALNYKKLPYKIHYIELPDIRETCISYGFRPTSTDPKTGFPKWTLPVLRDATNGDDGSEGVVVVEDSLKIIKYLDERYPDAPISDSAEETPSSSSAGYRRSNPRSMFYPSTTMHLMANAYIMQTFLPIIRPLVLPVVYEAHTEYARPAWLDRAAGGRPITEAAPLPGSPEYHEQIKRMREALTALAEFFEHDQHDICPPTGTLSKRKSVIGDGAVANAKAATNRLATPLLWINGLAPSFADFALVSCLAFLQGKDLWDQVKSIDSGRWDKYFQEALSLFVLKPISEDVPEVQRGC